MNEELELEWKTHKQITQSFFDTLLFSIFNYSRGPMNWRDNFFLRVSDEFIETLTAIEKLMENGFRNQCRRELRFGLETAIKAAFINQSNPKSSFEDQLIIYRKLLKDPGITVISRVSFPLINDKLLVEEFKTEIRQMYGVLSNYIHTTPEQLMEKITLAKDGKPFEKLGLSELKILNGEVGRVFSYICVLLFNSMPQFVVGDFMEPRPKEWYFHKSKFIAKVDEEFDYKHERQATLAELKVRRTKEIEF